MSDFMDFLEPFCAGWNARHKHGVGKNGADLIRIATEAYENSGSRLAAKVIAGEMTEAEAREVMGQLFGPGDDRGQ